MSRRTLRQPRRLQLQRSAELAAEEHALEEEAAELRADSARRRSQGAVSPEPLAADVFSPPPAAWQRSVATSPLRREPDMPCLRTDSDGTVCTAQTPSDGGIAVPRLDFTQLPSRLQAAAPALCGGVANDSMRSCSADTSPSTAFSCRPASEGPEESLLLSLPDLAKPEGMTPRYEPTAGVVAATAASPGWARRAAAAASAAAVLWWRAGRGVALRADEKLMAAAARRAAADAECGAELLSPPQPPRQRKGALARAYGVVSWAVPPPYAVRLPLTSARVTARALSVPLKAAATAQRVCSSSSRLAVDAAVKCLLTAADRTLPRGPAEALRRALRREPPAPPPPAEPWVRPGPRPPGVAEGALATAGRLRRATRQSALAAADAAGRAAWAQLLPCLIYPLDDDGADAPSGYFVP
eukprot:TRINITY_DN7257_c0_g1_i1.p2 TRINITY_DN7257_c0_g1~~TRINITY_DN7257_c0_g1_i1.p2  ORF type:complete len:413 (+),score=55.41 TRINITY_DN7257_c0_g1_i1:1035-2273(+)